MLSEIEFGADHYLSAWVRGPAQLRPWGVGTPTRLAENHTYALRAFNG